MLTRRTMLLGSLSAPLTLALASQVRGQPKKESLRYDANKAFEYAKKWCNEGNDCPSGQYLDANNTDCTHFMSHVLKAGGVIVKGTDARCKSDLCIRVKELGVWFSNATQKYSNVKKLGGWKDGKKGDICFQQATFLGLNLGRKLHVMLLNDQPKANGAAVYAHQHNRCGDFIEFDTADCVYYRIEG
jgi:hypothetical protein